MSPLTPDGLRYWMMAGGTRVSRPFHLRWLLPAVLGQRTRGWAGAQWLALAGSGALLNLYTNRWWAWILLVGCSGLCKFNLKHPVLVDLPAFALALGAAVLYQEGLWPISLLLVVIAGSVKESAPVFAAVFAWSPMLLIGLVSPALRYLLFRPGEDPCPPGPATEALSHPIRSSWEHHRPLPLWVFVLPWGVLLAAFANPSPQLWVAVALAYGQLLIATDTVRLYAWALPVVALCAVPMLDGPWLAVALAAHLSNPFSTEGL